MAALKFKCETKVEFDTPREAEVVYDALRVDAELRPADASRVLRLQGATVAIEFAAREIRTLRASVGTFYDLLGLAVRTLEAFSDTMLP